MQTTKATKQVPKPGKQGQGHVNPAVQAGPLIFARERLVIRFPYRGDRNVNSAAGQKRARETHRTSDGQGKTRKTAIDRGVGKKGTQRIKTTRADGERGR